MRLTVVALVALVSALVPSAPFAQPAPSFQAKCNELRGAMASLQGREQQEIVTIEVIGSLQIVREENGLVFLGLCGPPDPRVLCITYETNGRQPGDRVLVVGGIHPTGEDFVQLYPCLHYGPPEESKD